MNRGRYKLFPNLFILKVSHERIGIFHPLTRNTTFTSRNETEPILKILENKKILQYRKGDGLRKKDQDLIEKLIREKVLVKEGYVYKDEIEELKNKIITSEPRLKAAYFIITDFCNLKCVYCHINSYMPNSCKRETMSEKIAFASAVFFAFNSNRDVPPKATFYGGEPLLNFRSLRLITNIIRKYETKIDPKIKTKLSIVTNGTLVTKEIAKFIVKNGIGCGVSIDGPQDINDTQRLYSRMKLGSFKEALRGYFLLKKRGVTNLSISCTVGSHNVSSLPKIVEYFITKLKPRAITFNPMLENFNKNNSCLANLDEMSIALIKSYEILRDRGVYEDRIGRHFNSQGDLKFYPYDCAACGNQLIFAPNGDIGICHAYLSNRKYFFSNVLKKNRNIFQQKQLKLWIKRTPLNMDECFFCPAIAICGGGCACNAQLQTGSIFSRDERYCVFYKKHFLKWYVEDKYKKFLVKSKLS